MANIHQLVFLCAVAIVAIGVLVGTRTQWQALSWLGTPPNRSSAHETQLSISGNDLAAQIKELAKLSESELPTVTRVLFTEEDLQAREFIRSKMRDAGMEVRDDAMGNIYGTLWGTDRHLSSVATGSHTDAIPLSGMYDGTLGVIGGVAAVAALSKVGFKPKRNIEVIMFTSEEPTRFGISCFGSRAMAGLLPESKLTSVLDQNGTSFMEAGKAAGYSMSDTQEVLNNVRERASRIAHFVELHIEQGPELEAEGLDIGIVTAIAAPATLRLEFHGDGGHAGSQLMPLRNDASLAAAELCIAVEDFVLQHGGADTVGTCGSWRVEPNAVNSVPRVVELHIDLRDIVLERRDTLLYMIQQHAHNVAERRKVRVVVDVLNKDPPAECSEQIQGAAMDSVRSIPGLRSKHMVSHAYHDSLFVAQVAPTGMLFIPCYKGYSHRPDEFASPQQMQIGVQVLALTLAKLSGASEPELQEIRSEF